MRETGAITEIGDDFIDIVIPREADHCSRRCERCTPAGEDGMRVRVPRRPGFDVGQTVTVEVHVPSAWQGILILFVIPTGALVLGAAAGHSAKLFMPHAPNLRCALVGFGCMVLAYLWGCFWSRSREKSLPPPHILDAD